MNGDVLFLEIEADQYALISLAAKSCGMTVEGYILEAAIQAGRERLAKGNPGG